jgi:hypothetical protein
LCGGAVDNNEKYGLKEISKILDRKGEKGYNKAE